MAEVPKVMPRIPTAPVKPGGALVSKGPRKGQMLAALLRKK